MTHYPLCIPISLPCWVRFFMGGKKQIGEEIKRLFWESLLLWHQNNVYSPLCVLLGQITSWWSYSHFFKQSLCCILVFILKKFFFYYFTMPGLSCSMWDLVLWPGIEPRLPVLGVWSFSHWITREVPCFYLQWTKGRPFDKCWRSPEG